MFEHKKNKPNLSALAWAVGHRRRWWQLAASGRVLDAMRLFEGDDDGLFARPE